MTAPVSLGGFAAALAVLFAGGALAGGAIDPDRGRPAGAAHDAPGGMTQGPHGAATEAHSDAATSAAAHPVRGLAAAQDGLRIDFDDPELRRGAAETVRFRIVDDRGETVRDFDVEHTKRMHMIVVRRDFTGFQHVHPVQAADGSWSTRVRLPEAGSYRLFADFSTRDEAHTLATDLRVDGAADLRALPAPAKKAVSGGGYEIRLDAGRPRPGVQASLRFSITRGGRTVHAEPYLGAGGHLVTLREGDLAFLHVHPTDDGRGTVKTDGRDDFAGFAATFPTEGRYRLFLQFQDEGRVQTVAFTQDVRSR